MKNRSAGGIRAGGQRSHGHAVAIQVQGAVRISEIRCGPTERLAHAAEHDGGSAVQGVRSAQGGDASVKRQRAAERVRRIRRERQCAGAALGQANRTAVVHDVCADGHRASSIVLVDDQILSVAAGQEVVVDGNSVRADGQRFEDAAGGVGDVACRVHRVSARRVEAERVDEHGRRRRGADGGVHVCGRGESAVECAESCQRFGDIGRVVGGNRPSAAAAADVSIEGGITAEDGLRTASEISVHVRRVIYAVRRANPNVGRGATGTRLKIHRAADIARDAVQVQRRG